MPDRGRAAVGYVAHSTGTYKELTGRENVRLQARVEGLAFATWAFRWYQRTL